MIIATTKSNRGIAANMAFAASNAFFGPLGAIAASRAVAAGKKLILANKIGLGVDIASVVAQAASAISSIGGSSGGGPGSSGASSGGTIEAPDFNVVGATDQSQLAQTIAGAESKPVRAFVVGKDITTQQELDRNRQRTSSLG
jgi:hypothetical protein